MKNWFRVTMLMVLAGGLAVTAQRTCAQGFALAVSNSVASVLVSNSVTYTINVTNFNALGDVSAATVSNIFSGAMEVLSASSSRGSITNYNNGAVVLYLSPFVYGTLGGATMSLTVRPTTAGLFTNQIIVSSVNVTNTAFTNVVVLATNAPLPGADLGVFISAPAQAVITNDWTFYSLFVTNFGPASAPGVIVTNVLPAGIILKGASYSYSLSGSNQIFSLGTLPNGGHTNIQISLQPTNAAVLPLFASIGTTSVLDTNTINNSASNNLTVIGSLTGTLIAVTNSAQTLNLQNGLTEQAILLSNVGTNDVVAARVVVSGLSSFSKRLCNAVGTNNGNPFVCYSTSLPAGQSVRLLLQYSPRGNFAFTNGQLNAYAVPLPDWTPPQIAATSMSLNISRIVPLTDGNMLIEFPATEGSVYTVVYSDNVQFSNAAIAPPAIVAPANRVQWIDYGPPTTISPATSSGARFYRVFQNP